MMLVLIVANRLQQENNANQVNHTLLTKREQNTQSSSVGTTEPDDLESEGIYTQR